MRKATDESFCVKLLVKVTTWNHCYNYNYQMILLRNATAEFHCCRRYCGMLQLRNYTAICYCWGMILLTGCRILLLHYATILLQLLLSNDIAQCESMADCVVECSCRSLWVVVINPLFNLFIIATTDD